MNNEPTYVLVMPTNFAVTEQYADDLYNSCEKGSFTREVLAMQSPHGFLYFFTVNYIETLLEYLTFYFGDSSTALKISVAPCSNQAPEVYGFPTKPCSGEE
jgi:hypothetical protein